MASSCVKEAVVSVLEQLKALPYDWTAEGYLDKSQPDKLFQKVLVYNSQPQRLLVDPAYLVEFPAAFVEFKNTGNTQFTDGLISMDVTWRLHIAAQMLNTEDEYGMDENLFAMNIRDAVVRALAGFTPDNCSTMFLNAEEQDYAHTNLYMYVLDFCTCLEDMKGGVLDPDQNKVIYKEPPTNLELQTGFISGEEPPVDPLINYIWKACRVRANIVDVEPVDPETQNLDNGVTIPLEYALRDDGGLYIPYLMSTPGINILTTFIINGQLADAVEWRWLGTEGINVFYNLNGGFSVGDEIAFDASLPLGVDS